MADSYLQTGNIAVLHLSIYLDPFFWVFTILFTLFHLFRIYSCWPKTSICSSSLYIHSYVDTQKRQHKSTTIKYFCKFLSRGVLDTPRDCILQYVITVGQETRLQDQRQLYISLDTGMYEKHAVKMGRTQYLSKCDQTPFMHFIVILFLWFSQMVISEIKTLKYTQFAKKKKSLFQTRMWKRDGGRVNLILFPPVSLSSSCNFIFVYEVPESNIIVTLVSYSFPCVLSSVISSVSLYLLLI